MSTRTEFSMVSSFGLFVMTVSSVSSAESAVPVADLRGAFPHRRSVPHHPPRSPRATNTAWQAGRLVASGAGPSRDPGRYPGRPGDPGVSVAGEHAVELAPRA